MKAFAVSFLNTDCDVNGVAAIEIEKAICSEKRPQPTVTVPSTVCLNILGREHHLQRLKLKRNPEKRI